MPTRHVGALTPSRVCLDYYLPGMIGGSDWIMTLDAVSIVPTAQVGVLVKLSTGRGVGEPPTTTHDIAGHRRLEPG